MSAELFPFAVYDARRNAVAYIGLHEDEDATWQIYLGWPSVSEINDAKSRGMQVVPATLTLHHPEAA